MGALVLDISISLDGFVAGPDQTRDEPLGRGGDLLHEWALGAARWRGEHGLGGGEANVDSDVVGEHVARLGATVMGRRMLSGGRGPGRTTPTPTPGGATTRRSTIRCSS